MVIVDAGLGLGADAYALAQADPDIATGLETGEVVIAMFVIFERGQRTDRLRQRLGALAYELELFVYFCVANAGQQRAGNARDVTEPVTAVADLRTLQIGF